MAITPGIVSCSYKILLKSFVDSKSNKTAHLIKLCYLVLKSTKLENTIFGTRKPVRTGVCSKRC